jgi:hypothetical protein
MELPVLNQSPVTFKSDTHQYFLGDKELKGVTSTLIKRAYPNTYKRPDNYTDEQWNQILANAAAKGSNVHETIELYDELGVVGNLPELQSYIRIKQENNLTVLATEYLISDEQNYATAIDKVMIRPDGGIILVDFKRTYDLHIENVTLQQSICKRWFESLNPHLKVAAIYVMWLREDKSKFVELQPWGDELLDELIRCDLEDKDFAPIIQSYGTFPAKFAEVEAEVARLEAAVKIAKARQDELRKGLLDMMTENNIKSFTGSRVKLTRVLPSTSEKFDSKAFKEENPELYKKYCKPTQTAGSLRVTLVGE